MTIPRHFSDEQRKALAFNPEFAQRGDKCPVCLGHKVYTYKGVEYPCPDDDFGHPMLRLAKLYWLHNIQLQYQLLVWDEYPHPDVKIEVEEYIENFERLRLTGVGLTILSKDLGVGKTWTATYILRELTKRGYDTWFVEFFRMKNYYEMEDRVEREYLQKRLLNSEIIVIDDVLVPYGSEKQRAFYEDKLEEVVRTRTNMNFPTFVTSNLAPEEFEECYPRVYSLLAAKNLEYTLSGIDGRLDGNVFETNSKLGLRGETRPIT